MVINFATLQQIYPINPDEVDSFSQALTHTSWANENGGRELSNERLEFLGDAVLGLVVAEYLFIQFAEYPEGDLTRLKSELVREPILARVALQLGLPELLRLGQGAKSQNLQNQASVLADAVEAIIGWIVVHHGLDLAKEWILAQWTPFFGEIEPERNTDFKGILQEQVQKNYGLLPVYRLVEAFGPDHDKRFRISVEYNGKSWGMGLGRSKKEAEQKAAKEALKSFADRG